MDFLKKKPEDIIFFHGDTGTPVLDFWISKDEWDAPWDKLFISFQNDGVILTSQAGSLLGYMMS